jgi:hypothetical protein
MGDSANSTTTTTVEDSAQQFDQLLQVRGPEDFDGAFHAAVQGRASKAQV